MSLYCFTERPWTIAGVSADEEVSLVRMSHGAIHDEESFHLDGAFPKRKLISPPHHGVEIFPAEGIPGVVDEAESWRLYPLSSDVERDHGDGGVVCGLPDPGVAEGP